MSGGIKTPVTRITTRRRVLVAAEALAKSNEVTIEAYEEILNAVGQQFSEDFGVDCKVAISINKGELAKKLEFAEKGHD